MDSVKRKSGEFNKGGVRIDISDKITDVGNGKVETVESGVARRNRECVEIVGGEGLEGKEVSEGDVKKVGLVLGNIIRNKRMSLEEKIEAMEKALGEAGIDINDMDFSGEEKELSKINNLLSQVKLVMEFKGETFLEKNFKYMVGLVRELERRNDAFIEEERGKLLELGKRCAGEGYEFTEVDKKQFEEIMVNYEGLALAGSVLDRMSDGKELFAWTPKNKEADALRAMEEYDAIHKVLVKIHPEDEVLKGMGVVFAQKGDVKVGSTLIFRLGKYGLLSKEALDVFDRRNSARTERYRDLCESLDFAEIGEKSIKEEFLEDFKRFWKNSLEDEDRGGVYKVWIKGVKVALIGMAVVVLAPLGIGIGLVSSINVIGVGLALLVDDIRGKSIQEGRLKEIRSGFGLSWKLEDFADEMHKVMEKWKEASEFYLDNIQGVLVNKDKPTEGYELLFNMVDMVLVREELKGEAEKTKQKIREMVGEAKTKGMELEGMEEKLGGLDNWIYEDGFQENLEKLFPKDNIPEGLRKENEGQELEKTVWGLYKLYVKLEGNDELGAKEKRAKILHKAVNVLDLLGPRKAEGHLGKMEKWEGKVKKYGDKK